MIKPRLLTVCIAGSSVFLWTLLLATGMARAQTGKTGKPTTGTAVTDSPSQQLFQKAVAATRARKFKEAEGLYKQLLALEPEAALIWANLGLLVGSQNRSQDAIRYLKKAIELEPGMPQLYAQLASFQLQAGQDKAAEASAQKALGKDPRNPLALANLADSLLRQKRYSEAIAPLKALRATDAGKADDQTEVALMLALDKTGKTEEALVLARNRAARRKTDVQAQLLWADLARATGDLEQAKIAYQTAQKLDPENAAAAQGLTLLAGMQGDMDAALAQARKQLQVSPDDPRIHYQIGFLYFSDTRQPEAKRMIEAERHFRRAAVLEPKNPLYITYAGLALMLQGAKNYPDAEKLLQGALTLDTKSAAARLGLAQIYQRTNRAKQAIGEYRAVLALAPGHADARRGLAGALYVAGEKEEAYKQMELLADQNPTDTRFLAELGSWQVNDRQMEAARKTYETLVARKPEDASAWLALARVHQSEHRAKEATQCYSRALSVEPDYAPAALLLGELYLEQGKSDEAVVVYRRLLEADPKSNVVRWQLALTLKDQKRFSDALVEVEKLTLEATDPNRLSYRLERPLLLLELRRFDDAITALLHLRQEEPGASEVRVALAGAYEKAGRGADAEKTLRELSELPAQGQESRLSSLSLLGAFLERGERWEEAATTYEDALRLLPTASEPLEGLIRVRAKRNQPEKVGAFLEGLALADSRRPDARAVGVIEAFYRRAGNEEGYLPFTGRLLERYPEDSLALVTRAHALTEGAPLPSAREEAVALLKKCLTKNAFDTRAQKLLAVQYEALGRKDEARLAYKRLLDLQPGNQEASAALQRLAP